jgi:hypothetical protein
MFTPEAVLGTFRFIRTKLLRRTIVLCGGCIQCGKCCENIILYADGGPIASKWHFGQVCRENPDYERFFISGCTPSGMLKFTCTWLNGKLCMDHGKRLDFCKRYPTTNTFYLGHDLIPGCGYYFEEYR